MIRCSRESRKGREKIVRRVLELLPNPRDRLLLEHYYLGIEDVDDIARRFSLTREQALRILSRAQFRFQELVRARSPSPGS